MNFERRVVLLGDGGATAKDETWSLGDGALVSGVYGANSERDGFLPEVGPGNFGVGPVFFGNGRVPLEVWSPNSRATRANSRVRAPILRDEG
jgi:hypothetical protein